MKAYVKIDKNKKVLVSGTGENISLFQRDGMFLADIELSDVDGCYYLAGFAPMKSPAEKETETLTADVTEIDRKIHEIESKLQRSLLDVVIGAAFPLELSADDKKENAESKKYLLQYWKDKKELRRQRVEKLKRIEALKNVTRR